MRRIVLVHGGTGSDPEKEKDGTETAARTGLQAMEGGGTPLDAVVAACVSLEDDPRFNAGTGSNLTFDGAHILMDAACMRSTDGAFGAVAGVWNVRNPILVARAVLDTPHNALVGEGAVRFARHIGQAYHDPWTEPARKKYDAILAKLAECTYSRSDCEWDLEPLRENWNFPLPMDAFFQGKGKRSEGERVGNGDTVGAVATDGRTYAAAASTGGTITTLMGRIGDTPSFGAGVYAGEAGAVAATGNGDHLMRKLLAYRVHGWLAEGMEPDEAKERVAKVFPEWYDACVVVLAGRSWAAGGNRDMAWSVAHG